ACRDLVRGEEGVEFRQPGALPHPRAPHRHVVREHAELEPSGEGSGQLVHRLALSHRTEERGLEPVQPRVRLRCFTEALVEAGHVEGSDLELGHEVEVDGFEEIGCGADQLRQIGNSGAVERSAREHAAPVEGDGDWQVRLAHGPTLEAWAAADSVIGAGFAPRLLGGASSLRYQLKKVITKGMPKANSPAIFMVIPASAWSSMIPRPNARVGMLAYA